MSKISITKKIGKSELTFWVEGEDPRAAMREATLYTNTPDKCGICGGEDIVLDSNVTKEGFIYIKIKCLKKDCKGQATLGVMKDNKGFWWKEFEKYEAGNSSSSEPTETEPAKAAPAEKKEESSNEEEGYPF